MNLNKFTISEIAPIREALALIQENKHGIVMATSRESGAVIGLATDGDIRRHLLGDIGLDDPIIRCLNADFVWASPETPRELLLKKLDHRIRIIPLLDAQRKLVGIVSREHLPIRPEQRVYARARAPVRVSFGGGGSDLTHYFAGEAGAVINTTISIYSHAILRIREDEQVIIHSRDLGGSIQGANLREVLGQSGRFGLVLSLLKVVTPEFGFELYLHSDFPMKSGLGGSAVVSAAVLGCFNQFRRDQWDSHELAELAFQAERLYLGVAGGWQDQYATVFGGFNFMEFRMDQNIVHPLRISHDILLELEESLLLCDTGTTHDSGDIHADQRLQMKQASVMQEVKANVELSYRMRNQLLRGKLMEFGESLHDAWLSKRQFSHKISSPRLDAIYAGARNAGAIGGKLLGAGGGGFFLFYVPPFLKLSLMSYLEQSGIRVCPFRFEPEGLQAWTVREMDKYQ